MTSRTSIRFRVGRLRILIAVPVALLAAVLAIGPVAADTELGHKGDVGLHWLKDSNESGGAKCSYVTTFQGPTSHRWGLKRIYVRPPRVRAISGSQTVGWRFIVQRMEGNEGSWATTYRSPIQKRTASVSARAPFSEMGVKVVVPEFADDLSYRVIVKMIWFRTDGSQQGSAKHKVDFFRMQQDDGEVYGDDDGDCPSQKADVV